MSVTWNDSWLKAKVKAAVRPAASAWFAQAQARAPGRLSIIFDAIGATISTDPLGKLFEFGVDPHEIEPKGQALRLADGGFVRGPVSHPGMASRPFLRPMLPAWPGLYAGFARRFL